MIKKTSAGGAYGCARTRPLGLSEARVLWVHLGACLHLRTARHMHPRAAPTGAYLHQRASRLATAPRYTPRYTPPYIPFYNYTPVRYAPI